MSRYNGLHLNKDLLLDHGDPHSTGDEGETQEEEGGGDDASVENIVSSVGGGHVVPLSLLHCY